MRPDDAALGLEADGAGQHPGEVHRTADAVLCIERPAEQRYGLRDGSTTYEQVRRAVREHEFKPLRRQQGWDYERTEGSFTDTVMRAYFLKLITKGQLKELREIAYGEKGE